MDKKIEEIMVENSLQKVLDSKIEQELIIQKLKLEKEEALTNWINTGNKSSIDIEDEMYRKIKLDISKKTLNPKIGNLIQNIVNTINSEFNEMYWQNPDEYQYPITIEYVNPENEIKNEVPVIEFYLEHILNMNDNKKIQEFLDYKNFNVNNRNILTEANVKVILSNYIPKIKETSNSNEHANIFRPTEEKITIFTTFKNIEIQKDRKK
ncbi:MAG: hypothetical protein ACK5HP_00540 [Bacilli bacterium]